MTLAPSDMADPELQYALGEFTSMQWRSGIRAEEIGSPQRIAPFSIAMALDFIEDDEGLGTGRLILLHDPAGNKNWKGCLHLVPYVRAEMDQEMVTGPLLPEAARSWLTDALSKHEAAHRALAGTVTVSYGRGFGKLTIHQTEVEVRAFRTPVLNNHHRMTVQLKVWRDLPGHTLGHPPLPCEVVQFPGCS